MTKPIDYLAGVELAATALGTSMAALTAGKRALQVAIVTAIVDGNYDAEQVKGKARDALHKALQTAKVKRDADYDRLCNGIDQCISQANRVAKGWDKLSPQMQASVRRGTTLVSAALAKITDAAKPAPVNAPAGSEAAANAAAAAAPAAPAADPKEAGPKQQAEPQAHIAARMADELTAYISETPLDAMDAETQAALSRLFDAITSATAPAPVQLQEAA